MEKKKLIIYYILISVALIFLIIASVFTLRLLKKDEKVLRQDNVNLIDDFHDTNRDLTDEINDKVIEDITEETIQENHEKNSDTIYEDESEKNIDNLTAEVEEDNKSSDLKNKDIKEAIAKATDDKEDPQEENSEGIVMDVRDIEKSDNETDKITYGIDVAKWQGIIDWKEVKDAGVEFAMIRVGYRTQVNGEITEDPYAKYNLQQAQKYGIKIGVYFFSTAISEEEAIEEAKWVVKYISPYKITYPVAYNCEGFTDPDNRQYDMTKEERTELASVFLDYVKEKGYTPMFYAAKNELEDSRDWDTQVLTSKYKIWVAQYPPSMDSGNQKSSYSGSHDMWQYTSKGKVPGIKGPVDLNIAYFGYKKEVEAKEDTPVEEVNADPTALIKFKEVNETVTAKEVTNLRNFPGLSDDSKVIAVLYYGDKAIRTGVGDNGWSRVEYEGKILYAVSSYLTTDLNYKDNSKPTLDNPEVGITFSEVKEKVTAKIKTNLRLVPSTESDETIVTSLEHGDIAIRTGIGSNGWSRVEYEGQILYAVTNYLEIVAEE